jgi:MGT family glycosyltransferase
LQQRNLDMKVLMTSLPATGHLNPLLAIAYGLIEDGHDVTILTGSRLRSRVESVGAKYRAFTGEADFGPDELLANVPELEMLAPGPERARLLLERFVIDPVPMQYEAALQALRDDRPDVIVADDMVLGVLPMLLGPRADRPPIVACGTSILHVVRDDGAPNGLGLPPAVTQADRERYAAIAEDRGRILHEPLERHLNQTLAKLGCGPLATSMGPLNSVSGLVDAHLQLTVPSFEFPREKLPPTVHFVGRPPIIPNQAPLPVWADDLDGTRKVVLVTQGTVANQNFDLLIAPTLAALADERDLLVVVTTGGRPVDTIPCAIPSNARVASFLPFEWALRKANVFVTNGGYGSVNQAVSFGLPIVSAGQTEDKADVGARLAWSGVGIDLMTNQPSPQALREAVRAVLDRSAYRIRATEIGAEFAQMDTRSEIMRIITGLVKGQAAARTQGTMAAG